MPSNMKPEWPVVELRQYTLHPGARDTLIDLFDREFVETQEAVGMRIIGQFRDEDDPDRFVWMRAFRGMEARRRALTAFYIDGEAWRAHGEAAVATMADSSNALLLRPVSAESEFPPAPARHPVGARTLPSSRITATTCYLKAPGEQEFARFFESRVRPVLAGTGAPPIAWFASEPAENTFPRLPVRTGLNVFIWFAAFSSADRLAAHDDRLAGSARWVDAVLPELRERLSAPLERLRLAPTARSLLT